MNERIERLRNRSIQSEPEVFAERALLVTEAYKQTEAFSPPMRRALVLKYLLEHMTVVINEDELIVGEKTTEYRGSPLYPEQYCMTLEELESIEKREHAPFKVGGETRRVLSDRVIPYWKNKTMYDRIMAAMDDRWKRALENDVFTEYMISRAPGHVNLDGKVLTRGLLGLKKDVAEALKNVDFSAPDCYRRIEELKAMEVAIDGALVFAQRHRAKALELASKEKDPRRREELKRIARVCGRVPAYPARNFHEALQSYWFIHLITLLEANNWAIGPGRFDLYMYPFYKKDMEEGIITRADAEELLECLWVKFNNTVAPAKETKTAGMSATYNDFALLNIGGLNEEGLDGVNELSYLLLDVIAEMRLIQPNSIVLISEKTPERFVTRVMEVVKEGFGQPALFNADLVVQELLNKGKTLADARLGGPNGCVTVNACGKENMASSGYCNWVKILEITLNNGINPSTGDLVGLRTGRDSGFSSFDRLVDAYRKQLEYFIDIKVKGNNLIDMIYAEHMPVPFLSVLVDDCIQKGKDFHAGGARYNMSYIQGVGLGTLADSLAAVKRVVFDERMITLDDLLKAMEANFEGYARLRHYLLNRVPKYGNNEDYADSIMKRMVDIYYEVVNDRPSSRGGRYGVNLLPTTVHVYFGSVSGATPDGRLAGKPFSDGISPSHGADRRGPTSVINSAVKMDQARFCGTLLNQKFSPQVLRSPQDLKKFSSLVRTYFRGNGHHIQFNVIDAATLRKAQAHPEEYGNLVVRVAGYSDYFVSLSRDLQDEIIARTEQESI
ncbi:MAG: glycyl radical protein [Deltaproteobacteria bacterium]|nr:glycyl radical protein [Deltaproteobacteria bacterium]